MLWAICSTSLRAAVVGGAAVVAGAAVVVAGAEVVAGAAVVATGASVAVVAESAPPAHPARSTTTSEATILCIGKSVLLVDEAPNRHAKGSGSV